MSDLDIQMTEQADKAAEAHVIHAERDRRKNWLAVLARADRIELEQAAATFASSASWELIRTAEIGMVMLRGRIGGTGDSFNLGEATVTRCALQLSSGPTGIGYTLGRDRRKTELVALFDALLQDELHGDRIFQEVVGPLATRQATIRDAASCSAAASRVEFFTMVRGEA